VCAGHFVREGTTKHTWVQNIRTYVIAPVAAGQHRRAGGGINALRGECIVKGSTDMELLLPNVHRLYGTPADATTTPLDFFIKKSYEVVNVWLSKVWTGGENARKYLVVCS
jgi:formate dehydrogenase major subunit